MSIPSFCNLIFSSFVFFLIISCSAFSLTTGAYNLLDPNGNITINWDIIDWTSDGYLALVTINNFQRHRSVQAPGWKFGWTWTTKEIIWTMVGSRAINQGNCSTFKHDIPHSCMKSPTIVDLKPKSPYRQRIDGCCRGGVLASWSEKHVAISKSAFNILVGQTGSTTKTVKMPKKFTFKAPRGAYSCSAAKRVRPTPLYAAKRVVQAKMTWNVTCIYSGIHKSPEQVVL